jgi:hypothetical protein
VHLLPSPSRLPDGDCRGAARLDFIALRVMQLDLSVLPAAAASLSIIVGQ